MSVKPRNLLYLDKDERLEITNWLNGKKSVAEVAREFGISETTVRRISRDDKKSLKHGGELKLIPKRKSQKKKRLLLDECVLVWYRQRRALSESVGAPIIKETARTMSETWPELEEFSGSNAWFCKFKTQYGVKVRHALRNVKSSWNLEDHRKFQTHLAELKKEYGVEDHQVYGADEIEVYWRLLPTKLGQKVYEDRVTVMVCTNASGTHKVPLLVIGNEESPKCFEGVSKLPVYYVGQKDALMDKELLIYWYENVFLSSIREYQSENQKTEKVLLIMDTAPFRPTKADFESFDPISTVEFFPQNLPSVIQPMSCGITKDLRVIYKELFVNNLSQAKNELLVEAMVENYSFVDFCLLIASAWEAVKQENIIQAWSQNSSDIDFTQEKIRQEREKLLRVVQQVPGYERAFLDGVISWIHKETIRPGWKVMTDDEIVKIVTGYSNQTWDSRCKESEIKEENSDCTDG